MVYFLAVEDISKLLNTGLDRETLAIIVALCEQGMFSDI